jgi:hypothetical protein
VTLKKLQGKVSETPNDPRQGTVSRRRRLRSGVECFDHGWKPTGTREVSDHEGDEVIEINGMKFEYRRLPYK